jgi:hypothetical protein
MIHSVSELFSLFHDPENTPSSPKVRSLITILKESIADPKKKEEAYQLKSYLKTATLLHDSSKNLAQELLANIDFHVFYFSAEKAHQLSFGFLQGKFFENPNLSYVLMTPTEALAELDIMQPTKRQLKLASDLLFQFLNVGDDINPQTPEGLSLVHTLYELCFLLGYDAFQMERLEPFNKKYPEIPLENAPETLKVLDFGYEQEIPVDLSRFRMLEELILYNAGPQVLWEINHLPQLVKNRIKTLRISKKDLSKVNTLLFPNLTVFC